MDAESFDELYRMWPLKNDKANTRLAYDFVYKKYDYSGPDYLKAAELWIFKASPFQKQNQQLANWLRDEKFVPELGEIAASGGDITRALEACQLYKDLAIVVMGEWNRQRRPWWAKIEDFKDHSFVCERALRNEFFQKNWQSALAKAAVLFKYPERDATGRQVVTPTISWFCNIDERIVARIIEGDFGHPTKTEVPKFTRDTFTPDDKVQISTLFNNFKEQFAEPNKRKPVEKVDGDWRIVTSFTTIKLMYKTNVIDQQTMPPLREDQEALSQTMQAQANQFNKTGYAPSVAKQAEYAAPPVEKPVNPFA